MNRPILTSVSVLVALAGASGSAHALITGGTGATQQISPPASCLWTALNPSKVLVWDEQQNFFVGGSIAVDMINNPGTSGTAIAGSFGGGNYDSHFIHFDGSANAVVLTGTVTFSQPIAAVIFNNTNLDLTDGPLGAGGTLYPTFYPFRGLSTNPPSFFSISGNTLTYQFASIVPTVEINQIRVITHTPTPGAAAVLGLGGSFALLRRRRA